MSNLAFQKQGMVINDASQVTVKFYDGSNAEVLVFNANHKVVIPQFARFTKSELKSAVKTGYTAPAVAIGTLTFNTGLVAGDDVNVIVRIDALSPDGNFLESVNNSFSQQFFYQADATLTATQVATKIESLIRAVRYADLPFTISRSGAVITFTMKEAGKPLNVIADSNVSGLGTFAVTQQPSEGEGTYDKTLRYYSRAKVEQWMQTGVEFNMPMRGKQYIRYSWKVESVDDMEGGFNVASNKNERVLFYELYVDNTQTALIAQLDLIVP
jgi:hypothetical protein